MTLSSFLRSVRNFTSVEAASGGPTSITQLVQGSVLYDRGTGAMTLAAGPSLQRSGMAGRVFLDSNGNGRYDIGEQGLPRVRLQIGSVTAFSDGTGAYRVWDILAFEPVTVTVDSLSFESPLWVAAVPQQLLLPQPNRFTTVDIPLVIGGVVEGRVSRGTGAAGQGLGGVGLVLTDRISAARRALTSFSDGSFYTLGVKPGEYELSVDPRVLTRLRAIAESRLLTVTASGEVTPAVLELELLASP
ncbi:MAG: hypothetical protein ACR2HK_14610 [Gemmatimonadales bacterium]